MPDAEDVGGVLVRLTDLPNAGVKAEVWISGEGFVEKPLTVGDTSPGVEISESEAKTLMI